MASKKKSTKKTAKPSKIVAQGDKARFVRSLPRSMPAREIQARAAKAGMVISVPYVHNIRSASGKKARALVRIKMPVKKQEQLLGQIIRSLGPARVKKVLEQVETALVSEA